MRRLGLAALATALSLAGIACSPAGSSTSPASGVHPTQAPEAQPVPTAPVVPAPPLVPPPVAAPASASRLPGTLLVGSGTGDLRTVAPDGVPRTWLVRATPNGPQAGAAVWAPDGSRIAWSELDHTSSGLVPRVVSAAPDGSARTSAVTPGLAFFLAWDPTSTQLAVLRDAGASIGLSVVDPGAPAGERVETLGRGAPYYFAWTPDGRSLLVHVGTSRFERLWLGGRIATIAKDAGTFQTPAALAGPAVLYAASRGGDRQLLVRRDLTTGAADVLARVRGDLLFTVSPDGRRVAYEALGRRERDFYDRAAPARATHVGVTVLDLSTGARTRATTELAMAWSWSPRGDRLAVLEPVYRPAGPIDFRWVVWGRGSAFATPAFKGSLPFLEHYTPFFAQFAPAGTLWSPDGRAFAYPAEDARGRSWIWVQPVQGRAFVAASGSSVAWSPTP
ncbi:MAG: TolB family protein [Planctomycetaceae bacterium]